MAHFHCFVQQDSMQCGIAAYKWYANIMAESIRPTLWRMDDLVLEAKKGA